MVSVERATLTIETPLEPVKQASKAFLKFYEIAPQFLSVGKQQRHSRFVLKKMFFAITVLFCVLFLVACGEERPQYIPLPLGVAGGNPTRGVWEGNVFISEYLGLWFYALDDWYFEADAPRWLSGWPAEMQHPQQGEYLSDDFFARLGEWQAYNPRTPHRIFDLYARNDRMAEVEIYFERLAYGETAYSYINSYISMIKRIWSDTEITVFSDEIDENAWYAFRLASYFGGGTRFNRYFVNVRDGIARVIVIGYNDTFSESAEDILQMFGCISTPPVRPPTPVLPELPEPTGPVFVPPPPNHPLIGTWQRETDDQVFTFTFDDCGNGQHGRTSMSIIFTMPTMFMWSVDGEYVEIFTIAPFGTDRTSERRRFHIDGDMLTIQHSENFPDVFFVYERLGT